MFAFNTLIGLLCFAILLVVIIGAITPAGSNTFFTRFLTHFTKAARGGIGAKLFYWLIGPFLFVFVSLWGGLAWTIAAFIAWQKTKPTPAATNTTGFSQ